MVDVRQSRRVPHVSILRHGRTSKDSGFTRNVKAAKEAVLREDLQVMRTAIGSYTVDKEKAPQGLDDLVTAGYLKAVPKDPMTGRTDTWTLSQSDTLGSIDQTDSGGADDVHSGAQLTAIDGTSYNTW
jgi:general secretion pathway protein G